VSKRSFDEQVQRRYRVCASVTEPCDITLRKVKAMPIDPVLCYEQNWIGSMQLATSFKNGHSLLFILVRKVTPDKVLGALQGSGGKVIKTSLTQEQEAKLQAAISASGASIDIYQ
jgi:hypothetical protein